MENRRLFRIGAVVQRCGMSRDLILALEREGLIQPLRSRSKQRLFTEADMTRIQALRLGLPDGVSSPKTGGPHV